MLADAALVDEMRRFANRQAYDEEPLSHLHSEVVDFRAASEYFAPKRKLRRSDLETLRLLTRDQARKVPTVGAVVAKVEGRVTWCVPRKRRMLST